MGTGEVPPARRENGGRRRRWMDGDGDDHDDEDFLAEEDFAEELPASSAGEEGEDSDAEYQEDEEEEEEEETPRLKRPVKGGARGRKGKMNPATARAKRRRYEVDDDYEEEPTEDEEDEVEEYNHETPLRKRPVKGGTRGQKGKMDPATVRARRRRYEVDDDYEGPDEDEEEPDIDEEVEYHEEIEEEEEEEEEGEEEEEAPPRPKTAAKYARHGQNVEPARSHRRKYEEDDMDFEPELDEEEVDEDIDFDPEVDDEDEDEFEEDEEEDFGSASATKVTVKNHDAKRKSVSKGRSLKKEKANKGSKVSKRKTSSAKAKKSAPVRRVRKRFVVDNSDEYSEDDDDFIVDDQVEVNRHQRKKARTGTSKQTELKHPSVVEEEVWPNVESETSEFEFVTSDDEPDDAGTAVVEASTVRKGRKKRKSGSESSSDSEFIVSDKELDNLETEPLKLPLVLSTLIRNNSITRHGKDKGKEKEEPEEAGKPICGICLSQEQGATVQGVLNCCSHYFCFACIMEWSRVESRCPLCKQRFTTITKSSKADLGLGLRKAVINVEERDQVYEPTEEEIRCWLDPYENVVCIECNQGGDDSLMLLCDICDSCAHTYCVGLGREVPEGNWYCGGCRLSDEGPSHARTPHTVGYERQSSINHVDFSSVGFGMAAQNGTYDRSSSINRRRSFQGIDLNLSPREVTGEIHHAESQASTDSVSTPGRRATVSGRRQIHRYIRNLLSRPRPNTTTGLEGMLPSFVPHNGAVPGTESNHRSFRSSSEANTSQIPDGIQNQHNGLPFASSMPLDGDDFQHIEGVKSNLKNA